MTLSFPFDCFLTKSKLMKYKIVFEFVNNLVELAGPKGIFHIDAVFVMNKMM